MRSPASDETQDGEKDGEKGIIKKQQGRDNTKERMKAQNSFTKENH